ncbi:DNA topology modulation protein [Bradyrhizobium sp. Leo121]|uniref:DNA topology modulation protein n=1 Tax=Bradyrhizobium sp. Leo121 TaxID=1571195 RepID=UPI0010297C66|nr:DNA topology modulation protein [Bradyrhizobium sp. Leo121]RZN35556.1 DNA topology modulation protein [Bradyrhizobium sp. Leo121]
MRRILVMGSSGSGKSTFAQRLSATTGIPFVSLDAIYWKPGWVASDNAKFHERVTEVALRPQWVMDGNYISNGAGELRRQVCDSIIWFDLPRRTCMLGLARRIARSYGQVRAEMAEGCPERIDLEFFRYVWTYRQKQRPKLLRYFEGMRPDQSLVCFTDRTQAGRYLKEISLMTHAASIH